MDEPVSEKEPTSHEPGATFGGVRLELPQVRALIMKGGGAKGLAFVGAIGVLIERGASFDTFVGTSAGAITASLLAVDVPVGQLQRIASRDFGELLDKADPRHECVG